MDGAIEDPGFDQDGWAFQYSRGEEGGKLKLDEVLGASGLLLGRVTYATRT